MPDCVSLTLLLRYEKLVPHINIVFSIFFFADFYSRSSTEEYWYWARARLETCPHKPDESLPYSATSIRFATEAYVALAYEVFDIRWFGGTQSNNWSNQESARRKGFNADIVELSNLRDEVQIRTIYKPDNTSSIADLKLHWDGDRAMFTQTMSDNRWNVFEVKLNNADCKKFDNERSISYRRSTMGWPVK